MSKCSWVRAAAVIGLAILVLAPSSASAQQNSPRGKKYVATKDIVVEAQTGALRRPTGDEIRKLVDNLSTLANRSEEGLRRIPLANGAIAINLDGRFASVMLARPNPDGSSELRCVTTFEEGAEFLGLVEDPSGF